MNNLDQQLRDYYGGQSLPDEAVTRIIESGKIVRPRFSLPRVWLAAAAAVVLLLAAGALLPLALRPSPTAVAAAEVAKNHAKALSPEVLTDDFAKIQEALTKLDFPIAPSQPEFLAGLRVVGGRYCSIGGELAAQISLLDAEGNPCTLYIAPLTGDLKRIAPGFQQTGETRVQFWQDAHRIFALAR